MSRTTSRLARAVVLPSVLLLIGSLAAAQEAPDITAQIDTLATMDESRLDNFAARQQAIRELSAMGRPAVPALIEELGNEMKLVRAGVATALGNIGDERALRPLQDCLKDADFDVRAKAAEALGAFDDRRAVESLLRLLASETELDRRGAAVGLGRLGDKAAVPALLAALADGRWEVRWRAAVALGQIGDHAAAADLAAARDDENAVVGACAAWAAGAVVGTKHYDRLKENLTSTQPGVAAASAWALGVIRTEEAIGLLVADLEREPRRSQVPWVLNWVGTTEALQALEAAAAAEDTARETAAPPRGDAP
ncbi:MAG: HEAT repeat domain-containing protein [Armatimonadota bacterium]